MLQRQSCSIQKEAVTEIIWRKQMLSAIVFKSQRRAERALEKHDCAVKTAPPLIIRSTQVEYDPQFAISCPPGGFLDRGGPD